MDVYRVKTGSILPLGKQGENLAKQIQFDISRWISNFGPGTVQLLHQRSSDEAPYPVAVEQEGGRAVWTVTNADTAAAGTGRAELQYYVGDALAKSETWLTKVLAALGPAGETPPPEAQQGWVDQVLAQVAKITGMTAQAVELPAGSAPTADYADGVLTIGIPLGGDVSEAQIAQAVAEYLSNNPIAETDPTVPDWAKQPDKPSYTADEVGALSSETLPEAINTALAQAKESGEFDGAAGQDGAPGQDGITPTVGDNGNWYVGQTDTGVAATGPQGIQGETGPQGPQGETGATGPTGPQGPAGPALAVTNTAAVGQTVKITAVGEDGQPTEWEAVDMASGGGEQWELIADVTVEEAVNLIDLGFWPKPQRKIIVILDTLAATAATNYMQVTVYTDKVTWKRNIRFYPVPMPTTEAERSYFEIENLGDGFARVGTYHSGSDTLTQENGKILSLSRLTGGQIVFKPFDAYSQEIFNELTGMQVQTYATFEIGTRIRVFGVAK